MTCTVFIQQGKGFRGTEKDGFVYSFVFLLYYKFSPLSCEGTLVLQKVSDPSDLEQGLSQWNRKNKIKVLAIRYYIILCTLLVHPV